MKTKLHITIYLIIDNTILGGKSLVKTYDGFHTFPNDMVIYYSSCIAKINNKQLHIDDDTLNYYLQSEDIDTGKRYDNLIKSMLSCGWEDATNL